MPNKRAEGRITPTVAVEATLWEAAKAKASSEGMPMSAAVQALLRGWVGGEITITTEAGAVMTPRQGQ